MVSLVSQSSLPWFLIVHFVYSFLAKGGFGSVYKVKNRLDGAHYAIKKIILKHRHPDIFLKILREVTTLAQVQTPLVKLYCPEKCPLHLFQLH